MKQIDTCYFCTSPFQFFSILSIQQMRKETADLYIDPQFANASEYAERIEKLNIFNEVAIIDSEKIYNMFFTARKGFLNHLQIARSYLKINEIAPLIIHTDRNYQNMFVSSKAYLPRLVYLYNIKNRTDTKCYYFDDGIGSYYANSAYRPKKADSIIRQAVFGKEANRLDYERYLFSPRVYEELNPGNRNKITQIDKVWDRPEWKEKINYIFGIDEDVTIKEDVIILDQPKDEIFTENSVKKIGEIYHMIIQTMGSEHTIIKRHPRSTEPEEQGVRYYKGRGIPFECICMNSDCSNKVIVSLGSTASATPKTLLDEEPIILLLYRLVEEKAGADEVLEKFFDSIKESYRDKRKVFIPNNDAELIEALNTIHRKMNQRGS